jgi:hypothetical protein
MKSYFYSLVCVLVLIGFTETASAQGCVAVKNMQSCSLNFNENNGGFQFSLNYRYFRSYKHYRGSHEEVDRVENGTEVINNDNSINLGINYTINNRFSVSAFVPYIFIDRSSLYEHLGNNSGQRFHTQSTGFGDVRIIGYMNTLQKYQNGSLILGLGAKLPTGNYAVKDYFHKRASDGSTELQLLPVDQSIQLGDGGTGIIGEVDFAHKLRGKFYGYVNAMYMLNPRNTNGTKRSNNPTNDANGNPIPLSNEMSVCDQYMFRAGARYITHSGFQLSLGSRIEAIPSKDLVGKSDGFRRPGFISSIEPSIFYVKNRHTFGLNFPFSHVGEFMPFDNFINAHLTERNRTRSQIDIKRGNDSQGNPVQGDAAFSDWLMSITYAYKL